VPVDLALAEEEVDEKAPSILELLTGEIWESGPGEKWGACGAGEAGSGSDGGAHVRSFREAFLLTCHLPQGRPTLTIRSLRPTYRVYKIISRLENGDAIAIPHVPGGPRSKNLAACRHTKRYKYRELDDTKTTAPRWCKYVNNVRIAVTTAKLIF
jgi:hypothetical protein